MIQKLSQQVINKIAAGEVVQRPYNAIKQLLQNSIDAGATSIHIYIQGGGLKKLQIKDNGKGISVQDYPLLCQRYATSKIKAVTDLQSISSFGFRGQALASLTHVGDVSVFSRHVNSKQGYYAKFDKQRLVANPKPMRRQVGTTITVQNMFQMLTTRKKSLTPNQQKKMIKELIYHMALDNPQIEFSFVSQKGEQCYINYRDYEEDQGRLRLFCELTGIQQQNCSVSKIEIRGTKISGIFSKINTWNKWRNVIITINHRLIDCPQIQKVISNAYDEANRTIHKQNYSYCCYINMLIDPIKIDCNIHPTKKQIGFYKSTQLFLQMLKWMEGLLQESGTLKYIDSKNRISQHALLQLQNRFRQKVAFSQNNSQQQDSRKSMKYNQTQPNQAQNNLGLQSASQQSFMERTEYAFNKTRTDSKQLPLQYFYKNLIAENSYESSSKNQSTEQKQNKRFPYNDFIDIYQVQNKIKENGLIKNFFMSMTYVGCFNSSHVFVQIENKLYCFEISHFIKVYVRQILKEKRSLYLKTLRQQNQISVDEVVDKFLNKHASVIPIQKMQRIYNCTLQQLKSNRDFLQQKYGIQVNQFMQIVSYPIIDKVFENEELRQDSLAYLLIQVFASDTLDHKQNLDTLFIDFMSSSLFSNEESKYQMSPYTDKYNNFFLNQLIPTLKLKGKFYQQEFENIEIIDLVSEMMDLKDAYKMFERC